VKVDSLMYYNMSKFHFIILISQFMRAIFKAVHNFCEQVYIETITGGRIHHCPHSYQESKQ
jgi:hypothetical protein